MSLVSQREFHLVEVTGEQLDRVVEHFKTFLIEAKIPETYRVNIYKDQVTRARIQGLADTRAGILVKPIDLYWPFIFIIKIRNMD